MNKLDCRRKNCATGSCNRILLGAYPICKECYTELEAVVDSLGDEVGVHVIVGVIGGFIKTPIGSQVKLKPRDVVRAVTTPAKEQR